MKAALLLLGFTWASACATPASAQADALLAELADPPHVESVRRLVRTVEGDPSTARDIAEGLAARGGRAAAQGLYDLVRNRDTHVRIAALQGIAEVGLRLADGIGSVRWALDDSNADVRGAAFSAIGRVGDATDVPALLEALASDEERTRAAADRALSTLTGVAFSGDGSASWPDWWRECRVVLPGRLSATIVLLDRGGSRDRTRDARLWLSKYAWFDVAGVQEKLREMLHSVDARRRAEGYRAAAQCRLGDLADEVRGAARDETDPDQIFLALCSARAFGVEIDGFSLPAAIPDAVALLAGDEEETGSDLVAKAELGNFVLERLRLAEERLAAGSAGGSGGTVSSGSSLGGPVWLDGDEKRARSRGALADGGAKAATGPVAAAPSSWTSLTSFRFAWIGFPLVIVAIGVGFVLAMRRRSGEEAEEARPSSAASPATESARNAWSSEAALEAPLEAELRAIDLHPDSLAAAGVRPRKVVAVVHEAARWLTVNSGRLRDLRSKVLQARVQRERLKRQVNFEMASRDELLEWEQAVAQRAALEPELAAVHDALFDAATAPLSTDSKATLNRIRENRTGAALPAEYLVVWRSDDDRGRLDAALRAEVEAKRTTKELEPAVARYLKDVRADSAVRHAHLNKNELLDGVTATWRSAITAADAEPARAMATAESSRPTSSVATV